MYEVNAVMHVFAGLFGPVGLKGTAGISIGWMRGKVHFSATPHTGVLVALVLLCCSFEPAPLPEGYDKAMLPPLFESSATLVFAHHISSTWHNRQHDTIML